MTPLHSVAIGGDASTAQVLVEKGADVNIKDSNGVRELVCNTNNILVLLIIGYDFHNCVANFKSLVS